MTGGGLALDGNRWVRPRNKRYLFDGVALSAAYRDRLLGRIKRAVAAGQMVWPAAEPPLGQTLAALGAKGWEVYIWAFAGPQAVTDYLSRYVHQVAISNHRLVKLEGGKVTFEYYDNKDRTEAGGKGKKKQLSLPVLTFMRRWLSHVLPPGYKRIRYYGLHHSSARQEKLARCRQLLGLAAALPEVAEPSLMEWLTEILGEEVDRCPHCGAKGSLSERSSFEQLSWLGGLILSLFGQPTPAGVCR